MTLFGFEVPTFMAVKASIVLLGAFLYGLLVDPKKQAEAGSQEIQRRPPKHMGEAEEVKRPGLPHR